MESGHTFLRSFFNPSLTENASEIHKKIAILIRKINREEAVAALPKKRTTHPQQTSRLIYLIGQRTDPVKIYVCWLIALAYSEME